MVIKIGRPPYTTDEARKFSEALFKMYPGIAQWLIEKCKDDLVYTGEHMVEFFPFCYQDDDSGVHHEGFTIKYVVIKNRFNGPRFSHACTTALPERIGKKRMEKIKIAHDEAFCPKK